MKKFFIIFILIISVIPSFADTEYTGEKIVMDFYDADIQSVLIMLKSVSKKNFAVDGDVTGKVNLCLDNPTPWDAVLDLVLKMNQLDKVYVGNVIRIATITTLKKEAEFKKNEESTEVLITKYISINYSSAEEDIEPIIKNILTERGSVSVDRRGNIIIITDIAEKIKKATEIIKNLDKVTPQVLIEAKIVETSINFSNELGIQWGGGFEQYEDVRAYGGAMAVNLPTKSNAMNIGLAFSKFSSTPFVLGAVLSAMEANGEGEIISSPKITTLTGKEAVIQQGFSYPYKVVDTETSIVTTKFEDIDLILKVLPNVTSDNRISLKIEITKADLGVYFPGGQSFTTKSAQTEVLVNNGDTTIIGGIIKTTKSSGETGVPWLSKVPILGWFFKSTTKIDNKEDLLIFITPTIVRLAQI